MNVCKPHGVHECPECWPGNWDLGWEAAINRLKFHEKGKPKMWFDARDRSALTYVLAKLDRIGLTESR